MSKVVLNDVTTGFNVSTINSNFDKIETALNDLVLYRDNPTGEPNAMQDDLDMNGKRIYNLPPPVALSEAVRLQDILGLGGGSGILNATAVTFDPVGSISATNVQAAIEELDNDVNSLVAADIPVTPVGGLLATNIQAALAELDSEISGVGAGNFVQSGTGATTRTMQNKVREHLSITDFGADPAATATVNSAALVACYNEAVATNRAIYIPAGTYNINAQWTITKQVHIYGDGREKSLLNYTGTTLTGSNGVIQIVPPNSPANSNRFYKLHDFGVKPGTGQATNGLRVVLNTGAYFSNFDFTDLYFGDFTSYAMCLDNTAANTDGFFTGCIRRCWFTNGLQGINTGDSLIVENNTMTIGTNTRTMASLLWTALANQGVRNNVIRDNNMTCAGGGMVLINCEKTRIENNQIEHPAYLGINYLGSYDAFIYMYNCKWCTFLDNTVSPGAATIVGPTYAMLLQGSPANSCKYNTIRNNSIDKGEVEHIRFDNGTMLNIVGFNNYVTSPGVSPVITLYSHATTPQVGVPLNMSYVNSWTTHAQFDPVTLTLGEDGWADIRGCVANASVPGDGSVCALPLVVTVPHRSRFITNANDNDTTNSIVEVRQISGPGSNAYVYVVNGPVPTKVGLDTLRFRWIPYYGE